mmetsp:Transcript_22942/g.63863  ORF Transcript_22942/g.63863 Transcript_22942/m.63863 type:complete len:166 (+) Transcript_22942:47-544(+)
MFKTNTSVALLYFLYQAQKYALAFTIDSAPSVSIRHFSPSPLFQSSSAAADGDEAPSSLQKQQELVMEELSRIGADKIATLDVNERTRRALLAELLEDKIFENTAQLETLVDEAGAIAEENRAQALEIAEQTKVWQVQYQELVSGKPSSVLASVEAAVPRKEDVE